MPLDYYDKKDIQDKIDRSQKQTGRDIAALREEMRNQHRAEVGNQQILLDAFNRMAGAINSLAAEIKGLRADMQPRLDKAKLAAPKIQTGEGAEP